MLQYIFTTLLIYVLFVSKIKVSTHKFKNDALKKEYNNF